MRHKRVSESTANTHPIFINVVLCGVSQFIIFLPLFLRFTRNLTVLGLYRLTEDPHVIDESGPKGVRFKIFPASNIQAIERVLQTGGSQFGGDHNTVNIDSSFGSVPHEADSVPVIVRDDGRGVQGLTETSAVWFYVCR